MPLVFHLTIVTQSIGGETAKGQFPKDTFYFDFAKRTFSPGPKLLVCSLYTLAKTELLYPKNAEALVAMDFK